MKYIRYYNEEAKYLIDKPELQYPTVSYTEDTTTVHYVSKPKVNTIRMTFSITQDDVDQNGGNDMVVWDSASQFDSVTVDGIEQATPITTNELEINYTDDDEFRLTDSSYINTFLRTMSFTFDEPIEQNAKVVFVWHNRYHIEDGEWYGVIYSETLEDIMKNYDYTLDMTDDNRIEAITIQVGLEFNDAYQGSVSIHRYVDDEDPYDFTLTKDNFIPTIITYTTGGIMSLKLPTTEVKDYNVVATKFENVTDMNSMFYGCSGLTSIDLSSFDTSNVTDMGSMFGDCSGLTSLDLSSFDTSNVIYMNNMFLDCSGLTSITFGSQANVGKVTVAYDMFKNITTTGTLYYPSAYADAWNNIIVTNQLINKFPSTWTAMAVDYESANNPS